MLKTAVKLKQTYTKTLQKNPSSKAWTCAEISRPVMRDAPVCRKASATLNSLYLSIYEAHEKYDAPMNIKASATI